MLNPPRTICKAVAGQGSNNYAMPQTAAKIIEHLPEASATFIRIGSLAPNDLKIIAGL